MQDKEARVRIGTFRVTRILVLRFAILRLSYPNQNFIPRTLEPVGTHANTAESVLRRGIRDECFLYW